MQRKTAVGMFLGVCVILAVLLLVHAIRPIVSGLIFAVALLVFGGASRGFRRANDNATKE